MIIFVLATGIVYKKRDFFYETVLETRPGNDGKQSLSYR
ncbi:Uncharacterized protein dnm_023560 [Desulfonema magnum]|uniref:Uncharacterized protein n=1 Tax=Desulfonema magnum TaxID=45655 RepID=A0A975BJJ8_9BACT|nr:Uncharacterized protein dnm_023560 [Desulfonema magnum]